MALTRRTMDDIFGEWGKFLEPFTLGFEDFFNDVHSRAQRYKVGGYPPYNIVRPDDNHTCIEVALAGFAKGDIQVYVENDVLYIKHEKEETEECCDENYVHRGIAKRAFCLSFKILDKIVVDSAAMKDGMLRVNLKKMELEVKKNVIEVK